MEITTSWFFRLRGRIFIPSQAYQNITQARAIADDLSRRRDYPIQIIPGLLKSLPTVKPTPCNAGYG